MMKVPPKKEKTQMFILDLRMTGHQKIQCSVIRLKQIVGFLSNYFLVSLKLIACFIFLIQSVIVTVV